MKGGDNMKIRKGFTLIELLVVIAIIGILSTLAVVALQNARLKSRDAKRVSDIKQIQTAMELYFAENNSYPGNAVAGAADTLGSTAQNCLISTGFTTAALCTGTVFMGQVPANPTPNGAAYTYLAFPGTCTGVSSASCSDYTLTFTLEGQTGSLAADAYTATKDGIKATP